MGNVRTKVDDICILLEQNANGLKISEIAEYVKIKPSIVESLVNVLQSVGVVLIDYSPITGNRVILKQRRWGTNSIKPVGKVIDEYILNVKGITADVEIIKPKGSLVYQYILTETNIAPYTLAYLEGVRDAIARSVIISPEELVDNRKINIVYEKFKRSAEPYFDFHDIFRSTQKQILLGSLLIQMYGLGKLEFFLADNDLEEIGINGSSYPVSVYHKKFGWCKTNIIIPTEDEIFEYSAQIARRSGRDITLLSPIMDAHLETGDRVAATMFPITSSGNTITIRKFARKPWTIVDFIDPAINTLDLNMAAFLWMAVQYELNILVSGGTASGKTSLLNTLVSLIPANQRIVSIEDTREINLPEFAKWNWIPMATRSENIEGKGKVDMLDLIQASFRLRPERMIVGEVRKPNEAQAMFEAMHTGHAVYTTMHSENANQILRRLSNDPFKISPVELDSLHLIVVQYRDRKTGKRRCYEISEVLSSKGNQMPTLNKVYLWHPRTDKFEKLSESIRVFEELNLFTGMSPKQLASELNDKKKVLDWMLKKGVRDVDSVGKIVNAYYTNPGKTLKLINSKASPDEVYGILKE